MISWWLTVLKRTLTNPVLLMKIPLSTKRQTMMKTQKFKDNFRNEINVIFLDFLFDDSLTKGFSSYSKYKKIDIIALSY